MNYYAKNLLQFTIVQLELLGDGSLHRSEAAELVALGIRYHSTAIVGRPMTGADRKRFSLVAGRLERAGLIVRIRALDGRSTHYQLTADGIDAGVAAVRCDGTEPDHAALARGVDLVRASWNLSPYAMEGSNNDRSTKKKKRNTPRPGVGKRRHLAA